MNSYSRSGRSAAFEPSPNCSRAALQHLANRGSAVCHDVLELSGAMQRSVLSQDALSGAIADPETLLVGHVGQNPHRLLGIFRKQNLLARCEELREAGPIVR